MIITIPTPAICATAIPKLRSQTCIPVHTITRAIGRHRLGRRLSASTSLPRDEVRNLRIELVDEKGEEVVEDWWRHHMPLLRTFPCLETVDLLVPRDLRYYAPQYIEDAYFGERCDKERGVRIVQMGSGEWVDGETVGVYADWVESFGGRVEEGLTRVVEWDVDEETRRERMDDVRALKMPRPRVRLDYP